MSEKRTSDKSELATKEGALKKASGGAEREKEVGGFEDHGLLEPTRYNDWEVKGRCSDF